MYLQSPHIAMFTKAHLAKWSFGDLKWLYLVVKQYVQSVPKLFYKSLSNKQTYNNNTTFIERYHSAVEKNISIRKTSLGIPMVQNSFLTD